MFHAFVEIHVGSGLAWAICTGMVGIVASKAERLADTFRAFERQKERERK